MTVLLWQRVAALVAVGWTLVSPVDVRAQAASDVDYPPNRRYLKECRYDDGTPVPADECALSRKAFAEELEEKKRKAAIYQRLIGPTASESDVKSRVRSKQEADAVAEAQERAAQDADRLRRINEQLAAEERRDREAQRREDAAAAKAKATCGPDFKNPSIGMSVDRLRQCISSSLKVAGQINRADGIVTTYTTGSGAFFHVMNGKVIAWGR